MPRVTGPTPGPVTRIDLVAAALTLTDAAAAETEITTPRYKALIDLSRYSQIRLLVNCSTVGTASTVIRLQWCATAGGTYLEFAATNLPSVSLAAQGLIDSGWVTIPAAAQTAEVFLRPATFGGDATADPVISRLEVLIR